MRIVNTTRYMKNYKSMRVGNTRFILHSDIMIINVDSDVYIVYRGGLLLGSVFNTRKIYTKTTNFNYSTTTWNKNTICGTRFTHEIPISHNDNNLWVCSKTV